MSSDRPSHYVAPVVAEQPPTDAINVKGKPASLWRDAWTDLRRRPSFWISLGIVALILLMALWPTLFTQTPPNNQCELGNSNAGPAAGHPLGYTFQGCDIWSRIVWGSRTSISVGLLATIISSTLGLIMGAFAGYYGGWLDAVLSRVGDIFFSIPYILAAVVVMTVFAQYRNVFTLALAIGGFAWAATARVVRAEVLRVKQADFVMASAALGKGRFGTLLSHVIPNAFAPLLVLATLALAGGIVAEATLSFLGVGLGSDVMSWGNDISQAQRSLRVAPMALIYPSIALTITVLAFILLGELIRDALDPRARARR
ncbi:ABC transporter permease [Microbacterium oxydans]|jgi:oligopeptide transport system permease protein|uniref:Glutathione transport system permease protein GsiD n=1 Tax=Microbacterium oxydans TaxID=82380 RepID=A0A147DW57_9MICO|nr:MULTISPECIES: ABC transporter permease [Microbacterium]AZS41129.1 Glutathione transport system permease protein GsiD [Microbacterium oxydans]KAB1893910.1 ABC transporter permease [Microbacterium oxydans]KKX96304.1 peptide ABC transporter permease [Microbacterium sp. Ag1]KTR74584.1 peptide ABC transporter permease [Microbacterium oxydans]MBE7953974.1 ABC transporter permease [Microbacterium sp. R1]